MARLLLLLLKADAMTCNDALKLYAKSQTFHIHNKGFQYQEALYIKLYAQSFL